MISGIGVSAYSGYNGQSESVSGTALVSDVKNDQKSKGAEAEQEQADIEDTVTISDEAKQLLADEKTDEAKLPAEKIAEPKEAKTIETEQLPAEKRVETPNEKQDAKEKLPAEREKVAEKLLAEKKLESNDEKDNEKTSDIKPKAESDLTQEELQQVQQLKARDTEVRAHEQAHIAAAAGLRTSAASYDYQAGPDGKKYAVGGEVSISFTSSGNPEDDIQNAETMRNAALAPSEPSGQDRSVAKSAEKIIQDAKTKLAEQQDQQKEQITDSAKQTPAQMLMGAGII